MLGGVEKTEESFLNASRPVLARLGLALVAVVSLSSAWTDDPVAQAATKDAAAGAGDGIDFAKEPMDKVHVRGVSVAGDEHVYAYSTPWEMI